MSRAVVTTELVSEPAPCSGKLEALKGGGHPVNLARIGRRFARMSLVVRKRHGHSIISSANTPAFNGKSGHEAALTLMVKAIAWIDAALTVGERVAPQFPQWLETQRTELEKLAAESVVRDMWY